MATRQEKLIDIKAHPENHRHDFTSLIHCCTDDTGAVDAGLLQAHAGLLGRNGGIACDVLEGPCSCGAWHKVVDGVRQ